MLKTREIAVVSWAAQIGLTLAIQHASQSIIALYQPYIYGGFHAANFAKSGRCEHQPSSISSKHRLHVYGGGQRLPHRSHWMVSSTGNGGAHNS
jgi:hypothetical protein